MCPRYLYVVSYEIIYVQGGEYPIMNIVEYELKSKSNYR